MYQSQCLDGSLRSVALSVVNFCGGDATSTRTYKTFRDSTQFTPMRIRVDSVSAPQNTEVTLPILLGDVPAAGFNPASWRLQYPKTHLTFLGVDTAGFILDSAMLRVLPTPEGLNFETRRNRPVAAPGVLCGLRFRAGMPTSDSAYAFDLRDCVMTLGCSVPVPEDGWIRVLALPPPVIDATIESAFCECDSTVLSVPPGYAGYLWTTGDTTNAMVVKRSGAYAVTVRDARGVEVTTQPFAVTVHPATHPFVRPLGPLSFFEGKSVTLEAGALQFGDSVVWSTQAHTPSIVVTTSGRYSVTAITKNGCVGHSDTVEVTVAPLTVTVNGGADSVAFCEGDSVVLAVMEQYSSYRWSTGDTSRSIVVRQTGDYTVTAIDSSGCRGEVTAVRAVALPYPRPIITAKGYFTLCPGGSTVLDAGGDFASILWSNGDTTREITVTVPGDYWVDASNAAGCTTRSDSVTITVTPLPRLTVGGPRVLCIGDTATLDAGDGYVSYSWSNGAVGRFLRVTNSGAWSAIVVDARGCVLRTDTAAIDFAASLAPKIAASGPTVFCEGGSVRLDAEAGYASYLWSTGDTARSITVSNPGAYTVTVRSARGCSGTSAPIAVAVNPNPAPLPSALGPSPLCEGDTAAIDAGADYARYLWSTGDTTRLILVTAGGRYHVTVTDANGCSATSGDVTVDFLPRPSIPVITRAGNVLTSTPEAAYQWLLDGTPLSGETGQSLTVPRSGRYAVLVRNAQGCSSISAPVDVTISFAGLPSSPTAIEVYPDPSEGSFTIQTSAVLRSASIAICDVLGRIVYRQDHVSLASRTGVKVHLPMSTSGIFVVVVRAEGLMHTRRITVR